MCGASCVSQSLEITYMYIDEMLCNVRRKSLVINIIIRQLSVLINTEDTGSQYALLSMYNLIVTKLNDIAHRQLVAI